MRDNIVLTSHLEPKAMEEVDMFLWLMITTDKYELPLIVADSPKELAKLAGVSYQNIKTSIYLKNKGKIAYSKYVKVEVDDD